MKLLLLLFVITFQVVQILSAYVEKPRSLGTKLWIYNFDIASVSTNYYETSGLYSSPSFIYKHGDEWNCDADALLQRFHTNITCLANCSSTNKNEKINSNLIFEFLVSPKSMSGYNHPYEHTLFHEKYDFLVDGFCLLSGADITHTNIFIIKFPHIDIYFNMVNEKLLNDMFLTYKKYFTKLRRRNNNGYLEVNNYEPNTVVAVANALAFVKSRRHVEVTTNQFGKTIGKYTTRLNSNNEENIVFEQYLYEIMDADDYMYEKLIHALMGTLTNEVFVVSNLVEQVSVVADLSSQETRELHLLTQRFKQLWETARSEDINKTDD